jgi:hypothetical protein
MFAWFVLGICVLLGVTLAGRWFTTADPKDLLKVLTRLALGLVVCAIIFLAVTGRLGFAIPLLIAAFWWFVRNSLKGLFFSGAQKAFRRAASASSANGSESDIRTDYLRMYLNHSSGEISGEVLRGRFKGATLTELSTAEIVDLLNECHANDAKSAQLLETYLDKTLGPEWRENWSEQEAKSNRQAGAETSGPMTRKEALEVLGLGGTPDSDEIKAAHHKLMQKMHPDLGGSTWLASKVNQAKDLLLKA